jgi:hypothetical protein
MRRNWRHAATGWFGWPTGWCWPTKGKPHDPCRRGPDRPAELRGGLKGFRIFLACLTLGVAAIAAVGLLRSAIERGLQDQGAVLLGGDAAMEFTYRFATADERAYMAQIATRLSEIVDFPVHGRGR